MKNSSENLLGNKLSFLRKLWGFNTRKKLVEDSYWLKIVGYGSGLSRIDNLGKYERGERQLTQDHIELISGAFTIPMEIMQDNVPFDEFRKNVHNIHEAQNKNTSHNGLKKENYSTFEIYNSVTNYSIQWKNNGYSYYLVENYGKELKMYTPAHQKIWDNKELNEIELAFILMISIHFNAGWEKWVPLNIDNELALHSLFLGMHVNYWRTRFRILYSLQFFDYDDIKNELNKIENKNLSDKIKEVIKNYVYSKQVVQFLHNVANSAPDYIASRAKAVLTEIASRWKDDLIDGIIPL